MGFALKFVLLPFLVVLVTAEQWNNYGSLPETYKMHINKALKEANAKFGENFHINFEKLTETPTISDPKLHLNVHLIVTTCKKDSNIGHQHRDDCQTRKPKTPIIDCVMCKKKDQEEFVGCARLQSPARKDNHERCRQYRPGQAVLLFSKTGDKEKVTGCTGCI